MADLALSLAPAPAPVLPGLALPVGAVPIDPAAALATAPAEGAADPFAELMATLTSAAAALPMTTPAAPPVPAATVPTIELPALPIASAEVTQEIASEAKKNEAEGEDPLGTAIAAGATAVLALNQLMPPAPPPPPAPTATTPPPAAIITAAVTLRSVRPAPAAPARVVATPVLTDSDATSTPGLTELPMDATPTVPAEAPVTTAPDAVRTDMPTVEDDGAVIASEQPVATPAPAHRLAAFTRLLQRTTTLAAPIAAAAPAVESAPVVPTTPPVASKGEVPVAAAPLQQPIAAASVPQDQLSVAPAVKTSADPVAASAAIDPAAAAIAPEAQPTTTPGPVAKEVAQPAITRPLPAATPAPLHMPGRAPAREAAPLAAAPATERRTGEPDALAVPFAFGQAAPLANSAAAAGDPVAVPTFDMGIQQELSIAQDGQWLDSLARDIAMSASGDSTLHFKLNPAHLGSLAVQIMQGADGALIRLTADSDAARNILVDAQPKLIAEARAQGLKIADAQVDLGQNNNNGGSSPRGGEAFAGQMGQQQAGQQSRQPLPDRQPLAVNHVTDPEAGDRADDSGELYA